MRGSSIATTPDRQRFPELGFYALAGEARSSRELLDQVRAGEEMGFGSAFISERYNKKEAATLCGAAGAVSESITIATGATNHNTRHPLVTAGYARTMQSLALGGRCFDEVILHTYFSDETTARCVSVVKQAAEQAGRDPDEVRVWSCFATLGGSSQRRASPSRFRWPTRNLPPGLRRPPGRHQQLGRCGARPVRADARVRAHRGALDATAPTELLAHVATLIPDEWLAPSATGSPQSCVAAIEHQLTLGCDAVIMHGATPDELAPIMDAYSAKRDGAIAD